MPDVLARTKTAQRASDGQLDNRERGPGSDVAVSRSSGPPLDTADARRGAGRAFAHRWRSPWFVSFVLTVIVPVAAVALFALVWATPRYVAEFRVTLRSAEPMRNAGLADLFGMGGLSQAGNDANAMVQYLRSPAAVSALQARFPLREKFQDTSIDYLSRYHARPEIEALTRYWNSMMEASFETSTGTIIVRVSAFAPGDALTLARLMMAESEVFVNQMSRRLREDSVAFAKGEVEKAEQRAADVRRKLQELQDREAILDPLKSAEANQKLVAKLREQSIQRSAELGTMKARLSADSPSVRSTEEALVGLRRELAKVEAQATVAVSSGTAGGASADRALSTIFGAFQQMADERGFAEKAYMSALVALETARVEANRQQIYLTVIVPPQLPEEANFPKPLRLIGLTVLCALALWLIGAFLLFAIREHM